MKKLVMFILLISAINCKINSEYHINDIWIKNNGQWQVLLRMSTATKTRE